MEIAPASLNLRVSLVHVLRGGKLSYAKISELTGWPVFTLKELLHESPYPPTVQWKSWAKRTSGAIINGFETSDFDRLEDLLKDKGVLITNLEHTDSVLSGEYSSDIPHPTKQLTQTATEITSIQKIFELAKKHNCSEDQLFEELGRMIKSDAVVAYTKGGVSFVPVPENPTVKMDDDGVEKIQVGAMLYALDEVVPDVTRRKEGVIQLAKALGVNVKERAALIEADERMRMAREEQEMRREMLNMKKADAEGTSGVEVEIHMG